MSDCHLWPFLPEPLDGESLFSWFTRLAHGNGIMAAQLQPCVLPGSIAAPRDLDRYACDTIIANLAKHTGVPAERILAMHMGRWHGRMQEKDDGQGVLPWLLPVLRGANRRALGHPYCPQCLANDEVPYMRLTWRLSFAALCPKHKVMLARTCPHCHAPVMINDLAPGISLDTCVQCGELISGTIHQERPEWIALALAGQNGLLKVAETGEAALGRYGSVPPQDFFFIVLRLLQVLTSLNSALPLRTHIAEAVGWNIPPSSIPRLRQLHLLNFRCRAILVAMTWWLIQDWPHRFVDACKTSSVSARDLLKRRQPAPVAFEEPIRQHLTETAQAPEDDQADTNTRTYSVAWGHHRFWKLDGISPDVRQAAKIAARMKGENVGPWVDQVLREKLERDFVL